MSKKWIILIVSVAALSIGLLLYRALFWNFVENYEYAYMFDKWKGEMVEVNKQGWVFSWPVIQSVHTFDTRPIQICINVSVASSTGQRVLNCKLVRFLPVGYKEFIEWHGRGSYSSSDLENYLKIYAFDQTPDPEKLYPFLKIMKVLDAGNNKSHEIINNIDTIR